MWKLSFLLLVVLAGCDRYYLSIAQQKVNRNYLASTAVGTPDPRQKNPPFGQMLTMYWHIPGNILKKKPVIRLKVLYWDYTEETIDYPMTSRVGYENFSLLDDKYYDKKGILSYKADIVTTDGKVYREWKHQLWVNLINVEE